MTEKEYSINEILVVSFTEATASEIKARIIERLILALKIIESVNTNVKTDQIDYVLNGISLNQFSSNLFKNTDSILMENLMFDDFGNYVGAENNFFEEDKISFTSPIPYPKIGAFNIASKEKLYILILVEVDPGLAKSELDSAEASSKKRSFND